MPDPRRPTFMIIGSAKCGTTTLHRSLSQVSEIFLSTPKETRYFSVPEYPDRPLEWYYERFFADGVGHRHRGEASPQYTQFPAIRGVPERIHAMNPDIKLIYLVRDPIDRLESAYAHARRRGWELLPLEEALTTRINYLSSTRYHLQLGQYLRYFGRDQIHIETLRDLRTDHAGVLERVCAFLDVRADAEPAPVQNAFQPRVLRPTAARIINAGLTRGLDQRLRLKRVSKIGLLNHRPDPEEFEIPADLARHLREYLEPDIAALEVLTGWDLDRWRHPSSAERV